MNIEDPADDWDKYYQEAEEWLKPDWYNGKDIYCGNCGHVVTMGILARMHISSYGTVICKCGEVVNMDEPDDAEYYEIKPLPDGTT